MNKKLEKVSLEQIDTDDRTYSVTEGRDIGKLCDSLSDVGLLNPPCLKYCPSQKAYRIVCGFQRIQAAQHLGWKEIPAWILDSALDDKTLLLCSLHDNLAHREFNPVEKAGCVKKLLDCLPRQEIVSTWLPRLGLPPKTKSLDSALAIAGLDKELRNAILQGILAEKSAVRLAGMQSADREALFSLFSRAHFSTSKQAEIIEYCRDIAARDGIDISAVLQDKRIWAVLDREQLTRSQQGEKIRQIIKKIRYPRLTEREKRFADTKKRLGLPRGIDLISPPFFEGNTYQMHISFSTPRELSTAVDRMSGIARDSALTTLLGEES